MQMRRSLVAVAIAAAALLSAAVWQLTQTGQPPQLAAPTQRESASAPAFSPTPRESTQVSASSADSHPRMSEHEARMDFHNRVRTFFAQAPALTWNEKAEQARTLDADIERYQAAGELSAAEAFTLRLALIRESAPEGEQRARMEELRDDYRARSADANAPPSDPMFEVYKAREREIVAEVQSLEEIPDGLTRDQYLRQALQREREALLGN